METLTYFLALLLSFSGLIAGYILALIAPEELEPGKRYIFVFMRALLIAILAVFIAAYYSISKTIFFIFLALGLLAVIIAFFTRENPLKRIKPLQSICLTYLLFAFVFFLSSKQPWLFEAISSLIFLYGLPAASLYFLRNRKKKKLAILGGVLLRYGAAFLIISSALFVLFHSLYR